MQLQPRSIHGAKWEAEHVIYGHSARVDWRRYGSGPNSLGTSVIGACVIAREFPLKIASTR